MAVFNPFVEIDGETINVNNITHIGTCFTEYNKTAIYFVGGGKILVCGKKADVAAIINTHYGNHNKNYNK